MLIAKHRYLSMISFILFSGIMFILPYMMVEWFFGMEVPRLTWWMVLLLGNFSSLGFAFMVTIIEKTMFVEVFNEEEDFN